MQTTNPMRGHAAMLLFAVLIAGSFSLGGYAANLVDPAALMTLRFLFAAILIGVIVAVGPGYRREYAQAPWRYLILGGLFAIYFVLMFEGLKTANPISTAAVFTLMPIMSGGFAWLLLRQITTKRMALALVIGGIGALWIIFRADFHALLAFEIGHGEFLFFLGCIAHAIYIPMSRKLNRGEPALPYTLGMMTGGFLILVIYSGPQIIATDWLAMPPILWIALAYLVVFASAVTFFLLQYATLILPGAKVMAYGYLTPAFVIIWEGLLGHGWPSISLMAGFVLIIFALYLLLKE